MHLNLIFYLRLNHEVPILANIQNGTENVDVSFVAHLVHQHIQCDQCSSSSNTGTKSKLKLVT